MRFAGKVFEFDWLSDFWNSKDEETNPSNTPNRSEQERQEKFTLEENEEPDYDVSISKFEDDGSFYLMCLDWPKEDIQEWAEKGNFFDEWDAQMTHSSIMVTGGQIGGDIEVIETSIGEIMGHEKETGESS